MINYSKSNIYVAVISLLGLFLFFIHLNISVSFYADNWTTVLFLITAIVLLNHFIILLPPKGNALSMDSAIYLASAFIFGLGVTLALLFLSSLIFGLYRRKVIWWKHIFNFSIYSIMIIGAYYTFVLTGGSIGGIDVVELLPYIVSLLIYFTLNVLLIGSYFIMQGTESLYNVFEGMIKETISSYFSTLLLSIILGILLTSHHNFGLFLFTTVVVLLSIVFNQYFLLYEEVSQKANKDELTNLYNHSYFKEVLDDYLKNKRKQPLSLAFIDIDDFKKYNDCYGHLAGDELLKHFGQVLEEKCHKDDFFVARYGGEEFVLIMPDVCGRDAFQFVDKLRKEINDLYFKGVEVLPHGCLSFSGGIVEFEKDDYNTTEFIEKADQAMYRAKTEGKNTVHLFNKDDLELRLLDYEKEIDQLEQQLRFFLYKDVYTYQHSKRVFRYANLFSHALDLTNHEKKLLILGALIHDIGKIELPRSVINKTGKLEPYEWEMVKKHVIWGKEIVSTNKSLHELIPLVELHHERYDGRGYPYGLEGDSIPRLARILSIIDSFDAMTTERPYQRTKSFSEAIVELQACAGTQFDPEYVPSFVAMINEYYHDKLKKV